MIDWLARKLFNWTSLRHALFAEVDFYNSITRIMEDPEKSKTVTALWCEVDGWRGWSIKDDGSYFFNDIPEVSLGDAMESLHE